ncbi:MAG: hypothetical protein HC767_14620 [Akkermansiaceae bacterium]|nr:hypothetical protein [Akkermansiaceae bacterium]
MVPAEGLFTEFARTYEARKETDLSLSEYLEVCRKDPMVYATAAEPGSLDGAISYFVDGLSMRMPLAPVLMGRLHAGDGVGPPTAMALGREELLTNASQLLMVLGCSEKEGCCSCWLLDENGDVHVCMQSQAFRTQRMHAAGTYMRHLSSGNSSSPLN